LSARKPREKCGSFPAFLAFGWAARDEKPDGKPFFWVTSYHRLVTTRASPGQSGPPLKELGNLVSVLFVVIYVFKVGGVGKILTLDGRKPLMPFFLRACKMEIAKLSSVDIEERPRSAEDPMKQQPEPGALDPEILHRVEAVNYAQACLALEIGRRHLRRLIELGELERIGKGHFKRVTTRSIRKYRGVGEEKRT
jgi:hypothetical protein